MVPAPDEMETIMFLKTAIATTAVALSLCGAAQAQNFLNMDVSRMNQAWAQNQNMQMAQQQQRMLQSILGNPQIMAGHRAGICGPGLTPEQFAYKYAATGGCTAQGYAAYNGVTNQIGNAERAARDGYHRSVEGYRRAYGAYTEGYGNNQVEAGRIMGGTRTFTDPGTGRQVQLNYLQPGQSTYDSASGRTYTMTPNGQFTATDARGYTTPLYR